ncbi:hypothetical protein DFH08DRAFT_1082209 [Mycena albidolilacea]|uniref:Uncharacterized protein n=1 Tax=Mycena albidolilacea TaxID=1033008 RepID=A0AAD6ZUP6_9AGAR|nr:hypothetical protein DFH08DRAFT_1082209 [Mycena albidolilacea]
MTEIRDGDGAVVGRGGRLGRRGLAAPAATDGGSTRQTLLGRPCRVRDFDPTYWLSQANHIFKHLRISSNSEDSVVLHCVSFDISISWTTADPPEGFLFLCPPEDFRVSPSSFKWPECPAYWSLDPFGADPSCWEDAANLGFPSLQLCTQITGPSWDASVYAGICQFHQGKGFDPDSQDVALHLVHLLYELPSETHIPFAHIDDETLCLTSDEDEPTRVGTEEEPESADTNHAKSSIASPGNSSLAERIPVPDTFTFMLLVQLSLILCLVLFWLYDWLWILRFE